MSLLFPVYLMGLLGLALPWLLHRFSDQKPNEQLFPSRRFLEETAPPVSRTRALKYRTLMAVRMLSLLLLCLLFAQPWITQAINSIDSKQHHIVAIDLSLSMRATDHWENALKQGRELIDSLSSDYSVELVAFDNTVKRVADNSVSNADLTKGLFALQPGYGRADYGVVMQRLNRLAVDSKEPVKLWIITDQQESAMPAQSNALYAPGVSEIEILSTVFEPQRNIHLRALAETLDGVNVRVSVQVSSSFSSALSELDISQESHTVRVKYEERTLAERVVKLAARDIKAIVFDDLVLPPGDSPVITVSVAETDALLEDNKVSAVVKEANAVSVSLVENDAGTSINAAVFLRTAMETDTLASVSIVNGSAERVSSDVAHIISGRNIHSSELDGDVLLYVEEGNNALLFSSVPSSGAGASLVRGAEVGIVDESHPLDLGSIDWFGIEFYDVTPMALLSNDKVLVETTQRQPILVERESTGGRLLLLNDRLDGRGSNLPLQPAFVSLMQSILMYFNTSTALPDTLLVGERLLVPGNVQVFNPENEPMLAIDQGGRSSGLVLGMPGLYNVIGVSGTHIVNVLTDSKEADISSISDESIDSWRSRFTADDSVVEASNDEALVIADSGLRAAEVARDAVLRWLLPLLLIAIFVENILANRRLNVRRDGS
ncbi:MAG: BatA domain-containing protein [Granulosicoccus sp.]